MSYLMAGDVAKALPLFEKAVLAEPRHGMALEHAGLANLLLGQFADAERGLRMASRLPGAPASVFMRLGAALMGLSRHAEAASTLEEALIRAPHDPDTHLNLGRALAHLGDPAAARKHFQAVLETSPGHPDAMFNIGVVCLSQDQLADARNWFEQVVTRYPDRADALVNLAIVRQRQGETADAMAKLNQAIAIDPTLAEAHFNLGQALNSEGRMAEATESYKKALAFRPDHWEARWAFAVSQLPAVYEDEAEIERSRNAFRAALADLKSSAIPGQNPELYKAVGALQPFLLAYQESNNRDLLREYGELCTAAMSHWFDTRKIALPAQRVPGGRVRVGILSEYFRKHSVWDAILKGWFQELDAGRFSLHAFHVGTVVDEETRLARSHATTFTQGPLELEAWVHAVLSQQLDVLIYPEVGMNPLTAQLASLRLAPVQAASWGHPETTGLPTIDYYLSADDLEPQHAEANYCERLVKLPRLGCYYRRLAVSAAAPDLPLWKLIGDAPVFVCPGVPFKYVPTHDRVLTEIARRAGRCSFVFFSHRLGYLTQRLRDRLSKVFRAAGLEVDEYVRFIPWQDSAGFHGVMERADVFLDTIGFSGFNTAMQGVECGIPIVTREGAFMRGRLASGILRRMGLSDLIAATEADYVELAVKLATEPGFRSDVRERIIRSRDALFEDAAPIRALEDFLVRAAGAPAAH